jgi:hypothetical protein
VGDQSAGPQKHGAMVKTEAQPPARIDKPADRYDRWLFWPGVAGLLYAVYWFTKTPGTEASKMAIAVGAALVCMAFARRDAFEFLKIGSLEVKLREAQEAAEEARATTEELRVVAAALSQVALDTLAATGLHGGIIPDTEKLRLRDDVVASLRQIGVPEPTIERALVSLKRVTLARHANRVRNIALEVLGHQNDKYMGLQDRLRDALRFPQYTAPADVLREIIREHGLLDRHVEEAIADYRHFEETGTLRREAEWLSRKD